MFFIFVFGFLILGFVFLCLLFWVKCDLWIIGFFVGFCVFLEVGDDILVIFIIFIYIYVIDLFFVVVKENIVLDVGKLMVKVIFWVYNVMVFCVMRWLSN